MHPYLLHQLLDQAAARFPERDAVAWGDGSLTYRELHQRSLALAGALVEMGVKPGDRVGIMMGKSLESVISLFAILATGASYVPIDPAAPPSRAGHIVGRCGIAVLVASREALDRDHEGFAGCASLARLVVTGEGDAPLPAGLARLAATPWESLFTGPPRPLPSPPICDLNPAYILHTSGSTGLPKGVVISHRNALAFVDMAADFFAIAEEDRLASHAPIWFDLSVFDIFTAVKRGACVILVPETLSLFPTRLARFIDESRITVWNSVASVLSLLAERGKVGEHRFASLRLVIFSGDVLPIRFLRRLRQAMPAAEFCNVYGQTEANSSTCHRVADVPHDDSAKIPIGRPFPNFELFLLDEEGREIDGADRAGELFVSASTVAIGYWMDPERTAAAFVPDPRPHMAGNRAYRTGDLALRDRAGEFVFLGRSDHQVKSRGYRVQLDEIEYVLNGHPRVKEAVVVAVPDELLGNRLFCFLSPCEGAALGEAEIVDHCRLILPPYMIPEQVSVLDSLPRTPTGKIDRKALREAARGAGHRT